MNAARIHLAVALPAEAKPLIRAFGLRRLQPDSGEPPLYLGSRLALVLTGAGSAAMARGVARLEAFGCNATTGWLNLGIAGHGSLPLGSCLLADSITDVHAGRQWRLRPPTIADIPTGPLHCVREPVSDYAADTGYDMESAGFSASLDNLGALPRAAVLKIVSDGPDQPTTRINARMVGDLIQRAIPMITTLIDHLYEQHA
ncbi:MAG: hypothetical protein P8178_00140 [Candidatus Thiodiazotropha sp.]